MCVELNFSGSIIQTTNSDFLSNNQGFGTNSFEGEHYLITRPLSVILGYIPIISTFSGGARVYTGIKNGQKTQWIRGLIEMLPIIGNIILLVRDYFAIRRTSNYDRDQSLKPLSIIETEFEWEDADVTHIPLI